MKFGQKIFLMSFILIIIAINGIGVIMINHTYQANIESEIDKNMIQINSIMAEMERGDGLNNLSNIASVYWLNNVNMKLYYQGKMIYTNFEEEYPKIEDKILTKEDKETISELEVEEMYIEESHNAAIENKEKGKKNNITVYIEENKIFMKMRKDANTIITLSDISKVNDMKESQLEYFVKLSLISSFAIAFILSISVGFLTRKIKVLDRTVKEVENGNYDAKVTKLGNDEIGNVGSSFNRMTYAIQQNIKQIQEVSENRKRFIGDLTHEIRTPLTSIIGYSSLVKNERVTDRKVILQYCDKIYEEGKYIEKISQKLMDLLLVENGNIEIEETNISEELYNIIEELQDLFPKVNYEIEIKDDVYAKVDRVLLKSLIFNLVKNAIKSYEKDAIVRIELESNREIKVIDYGKGIPQGELEKIKEPFYTLSKDRNRDFSGMGLGLPLCIKIVEVLNGKLEIESKENEGTKIIVKLGDENGD